MDPATAIGVASAATAFADFSAKLLSTAHQIYKSSESRTERENRALSDLNDFRQLAEIAQRSLKECSETQKNESDVRIVLADVDYICQDYEDLIRSLIARGTLEKKSVIRSLGPAAKSLQAESKVKHMQERLDQMQNRIIRFTLLAIWWVLVSLLPCPFAMITDWHQG